jgi:hypothetical protein
VKLQQENPEQTGILWGTNPDPVFSPGALDEVSHRGIWMRQQFAGNASGIQTVENCDFRSSRRPMEARFEIGEVLLTASIVEVLGQFLIGIVARKLPLVNQTGECIAGSLREFGCLTER